MSLTGCGGMMSYSQAQKTVMGAAKSLNLEGMMPASFRSDPAKKPTKKTSTTTTIVKGKASAKAKP